MITVSAPCKCGVGFMPKSANGLNWWSCPHCMAETKATKEAQHRPILSTESLSFLDKAQAIAEDAFEKGYLAATGASVVPRVRLEAGQKWIEKQFSTLERSEFSYD